MKRSYIGKGCVVVNTVSITIEQFCEQSVICRIKTCNLTIILYPDEQFATVGVCEGHEGFADFFFDLPFCTWLLAPGKPCKALLNSRKWLSPRAIEVITLSFSRTGSAIGQSSLKIVSKFRTYHASTSEKSARPNGSAPSLALTDHAVSREIVLRLTS